MTARILFSLQIHGAAIDASRPFGRILENLEHRIMPKCSRSGADAGLLLHREF